MTTLVLLIVGALVFIGPTVTFKKKGELIYNEQVGGMFDLPAPERFAEQLRLLARYAEFNERIKAA